MAIEDWLLLNDDNATSTQDREPFFVHLRLPGIETQQSLDVLLNTLGFKSDYCGARISWSHRQNGCEGINYLMIEHVSEGVMDVAAGLSSGGAHKVQVVSSSPMGNLNFLSSLVDVILHSWVELSIMCVDWTDVTYMLRCGTRAVLSTSQLTGSGEVEIAAIVASAMPRTRPLNELCGVIVVLSGSDLALEVCAAAGSALEELVGEDVGGLIALLDNDCSVLTLSILWIYP